MPFDGSAGYGKGTSDKQMLFTRILRAHLAITEAVMEKNDWAHGRYNFIDLTAGPGVVNGEVGSPLIFLQEAVERRMCYAGWFCEHDKRSAAELRLTLDLAGPVGQPTRVFSHDSREAVQEIAAELQTVRQIGKEPFGLIYADPNGTALPVDAIQVLTSRFKKLDVLVHVSAANYKRFRCAFDDKPFLFDDLDRLGKKHRFIGSPRYQHQWAFILLTNWEDYKGQIKAISFYDEQTDRGAVQRDVLNLTSKERQERGQQSLW